MGSIARGNDNIYKHAIVVSKTNSVGINYDRVVARKNMIYGSYQMWLEFTVREIFQTHVTFLILGPCYEG